MSKTEFGFTFRTPAELVPKTCRNLSNKACEVAHLLPPDCEVSPEPHGCVGWGEALHLVQIGLLGFGWSIYFARQGSCHISEKLQSKNINQSSQSSYISAPLSVRLEILCCSLHKLLCTLKGTACARTQNPALCPVAAVAACCS